MTRGDGHRADGSQRTARLEAAHAINQAVGELAAAR
jgi:hypothetical protein